MSYLGLDIGTSGSKAVVFNRKGQQIALAAREYAVHRPHPGWGELDSLEVGDACMEVIREAAAQVSSDPVTALAISCQGEAFTILDKNNRVLANAMVSSDNRATSIVKSYSEKFGADRLYRKTGHTPYPIFSLFKLLWLRQERPDLWHSIHKIYCFEDYLYHLLGVEPAITYSSAGRTMLFNIAKHDWDDEILSEIGIRRDQLARPLESGTILGTIPKNIALGLGLHESTTVVTGGHDQVCAALGCGALHHGDAALGCGTVECITVISDNSVFLPELRDSNLCTYSHVVPNHYANLAYNLTGGNLLRWYRDEWALWEKSEAQRTGKNVYDLIMQGMSTEPTKLLVIPYLTGSGTPHFDDLTPCTIFGLRFNTKRGEILRAMLEGLCFELGSNIRILEKLGIAVKELRATGGGALNHPWLQLKADILNRTIHVPDVTEAGCMGCAMLACNAMEGASIESLSSEWIHIRKTILPNSDYVAYYENRYRAYGQAYQAMKALAQEVV